MKHIATALSLVLVASFALPAQAEGLTKEAYTASVLDLNRTKASQNPLYDMGKSVLNRRIIDKNQKTIGKVGNVILNPDGTFETITSKIDTSGFRQDVSFDVGSYVVDPTPDTFTVAMDKNQLKDSMAALMAQISTASGDDAPLTLASFANAPVRKQDGTVVAKVQDTLVDTKANKVVALLVTVTNGSNRGRSIAIPYEATSVTKTGATADLTITDEQALIVTTHATGR